ncbi:hypothetical protein AVEN_110111-1 [Araneus ventricosus]|uniref:Uncharacterized protein n=1 Tax=Araneus ventricosus TaxID=182803 RepID=A0A4Y2NNL8_ARAVE|nr:hypothetical protein AVEN_110111-1 [Araneus ventricosus]
MHCLKKKLSVNSVQDEQQNNLSPLVVDHFCQFLSSQTLLDVPRLGDSAGIVVEEWPSSQLFTRFPKSLKLVLDSQPCFSWDTCASALIMRSQRTEKSRQRHLAEQSGVDSIAGLVGVKKC